MGACDNVTDEDHWIQSSGEARLCNSDGTIGVEIPSATAILNPPAPIILPTLEAGGKDYEYIYFDDNANEIITTYYNYCSTSIAKDIDMALAEGEVNVQLGYQSYGPIEGFLQTFIGSAQVRYISQCLVADTQWTIDNGNAVVCTNTPVKTEVPLATKYVDGTPSTGCLEIQKSKYDAYKAQQESTETATSGDCSTGLTDAGLTFNDVNNHDTLSSTEIEAMSTDKNDKFLKEIQHKQD